MNRATLIESEAIELLEACFTRAEVRDGHLVLAVDNDLLDRLACFRADLVDREPDACDEDGGDAEAVSAD